MRTLTLSWESLWGLRRAFEWISRLGRKRNKNVWRAEDRIASVFCQLL
jgi:hypothetical protein